MTLYLSVTDRNESESGFRKRNAWRRCPAGDRMNLLHGYTHLLSLLGRFGMARLRVELRGDQR